MLHTITGRTKVNVEIDKTEAKRFVCRWLRDGLGLKKFDTVDLNTQEIVHHEEHPKNTQTLVETGRDPADVVTCAGYRIILATIYGGKLY